MSAASSSLSKVVPLVKAEGVTNIDLKPSPESLRGRNVCRCEELQNERARVIAAKVNELFEGIQGSEELFQGGDFRFEITNREIRILSNGRQILQITDRSKAQDFIAGVRNARCSHGIEESVDYRATAAEESERERDSSDGEDEELERSSSESRDREGSIGGSSFVMETDSSPFPSPSIAASSFPPIDDHKTIEESERSLDSHEGTSLVSSPSSMLWTRSVTPRASLMTERKDEVSSKGPGEIRGEDEETLENIAVEESEGEETNEPSDHPVAVLPDSESELSEAGGVVASFNPEHMFSREEEELLSIIASTNLDDLDGPIISAIEDPKGKEESDKTVLSFDISFPSNAPSFPAPMLYSSARIDDKGRAESMAPAVRLSPSEVAPVKMPIQKKRKDAEKRSAGEGESSQKSQGIFSGFTNPFRRFGSSKKSPVKDSPVESSNPSVGFVPQGRKLNRGEAIGVPTAKRKEEGFGNPAMGIRDTDL